MIAFVNPRPYRRTAGFLECPWIRRSTVTADLGRGNAALDRFDHELGRVELLLAQHELREHRRPHGAVAVRAVRHLRARDQRHEAVEEDDPHLARDGVLLGVAEHARAVRHVEGPFGDRPHQSLHLLGPVLAVGVERDDDPRPRVDHQAVAGAQRRAAAEVGGVAGHGGAVLARDLARAVARAVVDHQHGGADPAHRVGDAREDLTDVVLLVVCRDDDRHSIPKTLDQPSVAEFVPRDALERRRELALDAPVLDQRADREQEQHDDREHGQAEDPAAVAALERERAQQRVQQVGSRHDEQREARGEHQQHVAVAQRAPAPDRECDQRDADGQAEDAKR